MCEVLVKDPEWPNESRGILYLEDKRIVVRLNKFPDKVLLRRNDIVIGLDEVKRWSKRYRKTLYRRIPMLRIRTKKGYYEIYFTGDKGAEDRDRVVSWLEEKLGSEEQRVKGGEARAQSTDTG